MTIKCQVYSIAIFIVSIISFSSCTSTYKTSNYFQTITKDTTLKTYNFEDVDAKIRKGDLLDIKVTSLNPVEDALYNSGTTVSLAGKTAMGDDGAGFYVDKEGNIEMHKLGVLHIEGMTLKELNTKLVKDLSPYLRDIIISINFLNHQISVLGQLGAPGQIRLNKTDKISVIDAIALSGNISEDGDKTNVLIIRETENGKQMKRVNLENSSIFDSEWFYLRPNDVLYVTTNNRKELDAKQAKKQQLVGTISLATSFIILIANFLRK